MLQRPQRCIGLEHRSGDPEAPAFQQFVLLQRLQDEREHPFEHRRTEALTNDAQRRVVRRGLIQTVVQELSDRQRVRAPGCDRTLARQVLEEPDDQHLEVDFGIDPRSAATARVTLVERHAQRADGIAEPRIRQRPVETPVECINRRRRQLARRYPEARLLLRVFSAEHLRSLAGFSRSTLQPNHPLARATSR